MREHILQVFDLPRRYLKEQRVLRPHIMRLEAIEGQNQSAYLTTSLSRVTANSDSAYQLRARRRYQYDICTDERIQLIHSHT